MYLPVKKVHQRALPRLICTLWLAASASDGFALLPLACPFWPSNWRTRIRLAPWTRRTRKRLPKYRLPKGMLVVIGLDGRVMRRCLNVWNGRKDAFDIIALGDCSQQRGDTERHPCRDRVNVQPERQPRGKHQQHAGQKTLRKVIAQLTRKDELHAQAAKVACKKLCNDYVLSKC